MATNATFKFSDNSMLPFYTALGLHFLKKLHEYFTFRSYFLIEDKAVLLRMLFHIMSIFRMEMSERTF